MSTLPISPNVMRLHPSTKDEKFRADHKPVWVAHGLRDHTINVSYDTDVVLVINTPTYVDICKVGEKVVVRPDGSLYVDHEENEPTRYEVLVTDETSGDPLIEGAVMNAWGVDAMIRQFLRQSSEQRYILGHQLETEGELDVLGAPFHGLHFHLFAWTVNESS